MFAESTSQKDPPSGVMPAIRPQMPWRVVEAIALSGQRLQVRFVDGLQGVVDMSALVSSPTAGVFGQLADPAHFASVFVQHGAVTWPGEIDLAPDAMHEAIRHSGTWILG